MSFLHPSFKKSNKRSASPPPPAEEGDPTKKILLSSKKVIDQLEQIYDAGLLKFEEEKRLLDLSTKETPKLRGGFSKDDMINVDVAAHHEFFNNNWSKTALAPLLKICQGLSVKFGFKGERADRYMSEFLIFLRLKYIVSDFKGTLLAPTPLMDLIWRATLLETKLYDQLMHLIFGEESDKKFHHSQVDLDVPYVDRAEQLSLTLKLYDALYPERYSLEIPEPARSTYVDAEEKDDRLEHGAISIRVVFTTGTKTSMEDVSVSPTRTVAHLKQKIEEEVDQAPKHKHDLVFNGIHLEDTQPLYIYHLVSDSVVQMTLKAGEETSKKADPVIPKPAEEEVLGDPTMNFISNKTSALMADVERIPNKKLTGSLSNGLVPLYIQMENGLRHKMHAWLDTSVLDFKKHIQATPIGLFFRKQKLMIGSVVMNDHMLLSMYIKRDDCVIHVSHS